MTVRPRYQRAFLTWLDRVGESLPVRIHLRNRSDRALAFGFEGWNDALQGRLTRRELCVGAFREDDEWWDLLLDLDVIPQRVATGCVCTLCEGKKRQLFSSREELWEDHFFEPLRAWISGTLAPAGCLVFSGSGGGTWARLERGAPSKDRDLIVATFHRRPASGAGQGSADRPPSGRRRTSP